jgi:hypothetical protein
MATEANREKNRRRAARKQAIADWEKFKAGQARRASGTDRTNKAQVHRDEVFATHKGVCWVCNGAYASELDHVVPVKKGGSDHPSNLRPIHRRCNTLRNSFSCAVGAHMVPSWRSLNPDSPVVLNGIQISKRMYSDAARRVTTDVGENRWDPPGRGLDGIHAVS